MRWLVWRTVRHAPRRLLLAAVAVALPVATLALPNHKVEFCVLVALVGVVVAEMSAATLLSLERASRDRFRHREQIHRLIALEEPEHRVEDLAMALLVEIERLQ